MKRINIFILAMFLMVGSTFAQSDVTLIDVTGNDFTHDEYCGTYGRQITVSDNGDVHVVYQKTWATASDTGYNINYKNLTTDATDVLPYQMDDLTRPDPGVAYIGGGVNGAPIFIYYGMGGRVYKWGDMHHQAMAKVKDDGTGVEGLGTQDDRTYYHEPYYANPVSMEVSSATGIAHMINTSVGGDVLAYWNFDGTSFGEVYNMFQSYPDNDVPGKNVPGKYRRNATKGEDLAINSDGSEVTLASLHPACNIWLHKGTFGGELWDDDFMTGLDNGTVVGLFDTTGTANGDNFANNDPKPNNDLQVVYNENDQLVVVYTATYIDQWLDTAATAPINNWDRTYGPNGVGDTLGTHYDGSEHPNPQLVFWAEASGSHSKIVNATFPRAGETLRMWAYGTLDTTETGGDAWAYWGQSRNDNLLSHFNLISNNDAKEGEPKLVLAYQDATTMPEIEGLGYNDDGTKDLRYYKWFNDIFVTVSMDGATWTTPINITNTPDKDEANLSLNRDVIDNKVHMMYFRDSKAGSDMWIGRVDTNDYVMHQPKGIFSRLFIRTDQEDLVEILHNLYDLTTITGVEDATLPGTFALEQNYPNPFNPTTSISYSIPAKSDVSIKVFNNIGQLVTTLVNGVNEAGSHKVSWNASSIASGVYFYTINAGDFTSTKKMILLK